MCVRVFVCVHVSEMRKVNIVDWLMRNKNDAEISAALGDSVFVCVCGRDRRKKEQEKNGPIDQNQQY